MIEGTLLQRFVALFCARRDFARRIATIQGKLAGFRSDGLVVAEGQRLYVLELVGLLDMLESGLTTLSKTFGAKSVDEAELHDILGEMERSTKDPRWTLLDAVEAELTAKQARQDDEVKRLMAILQPIGERLATLQKGLDKAREVDAAVFAEDETFKRISARHTRATSLIADRLAAAYNVVTALEQDAAQLDGLTSQVREKAGRASEIRKRADLLMLQSQLDQFNLYTYDALLRTASEPGIHGISLHATSTLVQQDRDDFITKIKSVRQQLRDGRLRSAGGGEAVATREVAPFPAVKGSTFEARSLEETGDFMYRLLLPEAVQRYLEGARCSLTLTTNDLELPWELMHDGKDYLCIRRPVARMPMGTYLPPERREEEPVGKVRFLLVNPSPELTGAAQEVQTLQKNLKEFGDDKVMVEVLGPDGATGREFTRCLVSGGFHVIHFAGHAQFNDREPDKSGLVLAKGELFLAQKGRRLLRGRPLVFLNACESATPGGAGDSSAKPSVGPNYLQAPAAGLASAFVYGGALGCVGAIWPVYDDGAAALATELYREVIRGTMIGEAMRVAREQVRKAYPDQVTWAAFVLYGDPTFQLRR